VSLDAIIPDKNYSVNEGAFVPLGEAREAFVFKQVQQLARKHKIDLNKPVKELSSKAVNLILYGNEDGEGTVDIDYNEINTNGNVYFEEYEGIVPQLKRWFNGGTTEALREWVEQFMELKTCPECNGARLRKESLWFKVDGKNLDKKTTCNTSRLEGDKLYSSPADVYEKVKAFDKRIGLCIDIGHVQRIGLDPAVMLERYQDRLYDIHMKDVSKVSNEDTPVEIGRGIINIPKVIKTLKKIQYMGNMAFEFEKDENDPLPGLAESVGYVRGVVKMI